MPSSNPAEAIKQVQNDAAGVGWFPARGVHSLVSKAIDSLKADGAPDEEVAIAEKLSVCLFGLEVATWARGAGEIEIVREMITQLGRRKVELDSAGESSEIVA